MKLDFCCLLFFSILLMDFDFWINRDNRPTLQLASTVRVLTLERGIEVEENMNILSSS